MRKVIKNNYKIIIGFVLGLIVSVSSVYAIDAYIESNKVTYTNHNKENVEEALDELYERSGMHKEKWVDEELNGADPVLKDPLIPVTIDNNGDVYYANLNSEWYNYSEKRWANAVILTDTASKYSVGQHIPEKDIESYFVWIPRYQYKIWDLGEYTETMTLAKLTDVKESASSETSLWRITGNNTRIIDIKFGSAEKIPKMSESDAKINEYYTHPAFTLGKKELNGIWVGIFETGYKGANNIASAQVNNVEITSIIIKPNVYSWRGINIKNMFSTSYNYKRTLDSHMLKNTEWGAVAYLSHLVYGIGNEININNTSDFKTGYSAAAGTNQSTTPNTSDVSTNALVTQPWNSKAGYLASTTGNVTGIYDMSGGSWEFVAGCIEGDPGRSEFVVGDENTEDTLTKYMKEGYIDKYSKESTITSYDKRILGDATGEMGPFYSYYEECGSYYHHSSWYSDWSTFVHSTQSWFTRGGAYGDGAVSGIFHFSRSGGEANNQWSFRISLAI